jgi:hypothetical protein
MYLTWCEQTLLGASIIDAWEVGTARHFVFSMPTVTQTPSVDRG